MIGSLKGCITAVYAPFVLLEVSGVGYEVETPMNTFCNFNKGDEVFLWIHQVVREDAQLLYGFADANERSVFRTLIKINGVGAKLAITILSSIDLSSLKRAVASDDVARLVKIPGIGKKTGERLIIELRGKLDNFTMESDEAFELVSDNLQSTDTLHIAENEALAALQSLGYSQKEAEKAINAVAANAKTTQEFIRLALKQLAG